MTKLVHIKLDAIFMWDRELSGIPAGIDKEPLAMHLGMALKKLGAVEVVQAWREIGIVEPKPPKAPRKKRPKVKPAAERCPRCNEEGCIGQCRER